MSIGDYTNPLVIVAEDAGVNPIFRVEIDSALTEDLAIDLSFLDTAIFSTYTVLAQVPALPTDTIAPTNTSICYFVYPNNPSFPASAIGAGMIPCGQIVIPKGKTYIEVQIVQDNLSPRPTTDRKIELSINTSDLYSIDIPSAFATISPRIGRFTYGTIFSNELLLPECDPPQQGYSFTNQTVYSQTIRTKGVDFLRKNLSTFSVDPNAYTLQSVNPIPYLAPILNSIKIGDSWYAFDEQNNNNSSLTVAEQIQAFGTPNSINTFYSGECNYTEI